MKKELLNKVIYQVYVRNYTKEGTLTALINKLDYIKDLGIDIIYLLPIHEIGQKGKKGSLGCPYSIKDYYSIAAELGTMDDFKLLIEEIHKRDMKIMMDIVFHHTSRDSVLLETHPDWYFKNKNGEFGCKVGDWSDVYDLDHSNQELEEYLIENIKYFVDMGVDGFRFDVAGALPLSFFKLLRNKIGEETILLAESIELQFINYLREIGAYNCTDSELYEYFDIAYPYDVFEFYITYFKKPSLFNKRNLELILNTQMATLPKKAIKLNTFENHDQERLAKYFKGNALKNITALSFFKDGVGFVYGGQEVKATHRPSLFEKETIDMNVKDSEFLNFIKTCIKFKKENINQTIINTKFIESNNKNIFIVKNTYLNNKTYFGIFNVSNKPNEINVSCIKDGVYLNYLMQNNIEIKDSKITVFEPIIFEYKN